MLKEIHDGVADHPVVDGLAREDWTTSWYGQMEIAYICFSAQRGERAVTSLIVSKLEPTGMCMDELVRVRIASCLVANPFTLH
jgi:hypothetical protein